MTKFSPIDTDEIIKKPSLYDKTKFHIKLEKELEEIKSHKTTYDKRAKEIVVIYKINNQPKLEIEVIIDGLSGEFIFIGAGNGAKKASIASNPNGLTESIEEVISVLSNHVKINTFEKLKINKEDLKSLLHDAREDIFDEELEELTKLRDAMLDKKENLEELLEVNPDGTIKLDNNRPILRKVA